MPDYRVYELNSTGKIGAAGWVEARSDDEAVAFIRARKLSVSCEIWNGNRLIAQVPAVQLRA